MYIDWEFIGELIFGLWWLCVSIAIIFSAFIVFKNK